MLKLFTKADTFVDVASRWGTLFAAVWAGFSWVANHVTWLGSLNWAESIFVGLGAAMLLSLVVSFALIAVRFFKPMQMAPAGSSSDESLPGDGLLTLASIEAKFGDRIDQIERHIRELRDSLSSLIESVGNIQRLDNEQVAAVQYATTQRRLEFLDTQAHQIADVIKQHANDFAPELGLPDSVSRTIQHVISGLVAHGVDKKMIDDEITSIEAAVKGDAKYMVRDDDERSRFTGASGRDPDDLKRQWHFRKMQLDYLSRFIARKIECERSSAHQTAEVIRV